MTTTTITPEVNSSALLKKLAHTFESKTTWLSEAMQNSRRAMATKVEINIDEDSGAVTIVDDGNGVDDFVKLISVAVSGWDEQTVATENPFGLGLLSMIFAGTSATFESNGKSLTVTPEQLVSLSPLELRQSSTEEGLKVTVQQEKLSFEDCVEATRYYAVGFNIPVYLNGEALRQEHSPNDPLANLAFKTKNLAVYTVEKAPNRPYKFLDKHNIVRSYHADCAANCYFQSLPIEITGDRSDRMTSIIKVVCNLLDVKGVAIHIHNNSAFIPRTPDRTRFFNEKEVWEVMMAELKQVAQQHLDNLIEAENWPVLWSLIKGHHYFSIAHELGVLEALNACPYIPENYICQANSAYIQSEGCEYTFPDSVEEECTATVHRDELEGKIILNHSDVIDDAYIRDGFSDNYSLLYAAGLNALVFDGIVHSKHWIYDLLTPWDKSQELTATLIGNTDCIDVRDTRMTVKIGKYESIEITGEHGTVTVSEWPVEKAGNTYLNDACWKNEYAPSWFAYYQDEHGDLNRDMAEEDQYETRKAFAAFGKSAQEYIQDLLTSEEMRIRALLAQEKLMKIRISESGSLTVELAA